MLNAVRFAREWREISDVQPGTPVTVDPLRGDLQLLDAGQHMFRSLVKESSGLGQLKAPLDAAG